MSQALFMGLGGLRFWSVREIMRRNHAVDLLVDAVKSSLRRINPAWQFYQCETPVLTPVDFIAEEHKSGDDVWLFGDGIGKVDFALRPETTAGSYLYMEYLLHQPKVLFLDEPTIGLDVVAQHKIQQFLKRYQQERNNTILLTSHYMKDIEALCKRVVVMANGEIYHDGSLDEIIDQFSRDKIVSLHLADAGSLDALKSLPDVIEMDPPKIKFRVPRDQVGTVLSQILGRHAVADIAVEDPPLEEVISSLFSEAEKAHQEEREEEAGRPSGKGTPC